MNQETFKQPTPDEARAALAEVDNVLAQTRLSIARGPAAPILILWGVIWLIADITTQFHAQSMQWMWSVLDGAGLLMTAWFVARDKVKVRAPGGRKIGMFWGALFAYGMLWMVILQPINFPDSAQGWQNFEPVYSRLTTYWHTLCMFGYVVMGLWISRFLLGLGLIVTALILAGYYGNIPYYYAWLGVAGGGSLIIAGVFIRQFWK